MHKIRYIEKNHRFPSDFLDKLTNRTSLVEIVSPTTRLVRKGREYSGLCPFHKEKTPSFSVSEDKGVYYCFGCGASGNIFNFLKEKQGFSFTEAVYFLAEKYNVPLPILSERNDQEQDKERFYTLMDVTLTYFQTCLHHTSLGDRGRTYLEKRGINIKTCQHFSLGYAPASQHFMQWVEEKKYPKEDMCAVGLLKKENNVYRPWFWERLMFPIHDRQGQLVAFGGRRLDEGKPKYINSPETNLFSKKDILYGEHHIRQERPKDIFVVEGYMDVIGLWSKDVQGAVAPLGTAFSAHHGTCLWKYHPTPLLCFDGDTAGRKAALRGCQQILGALQPGKSMRIALMPPGQDPDDVVKHEGASKFRALCAKALPLHRFFPQMFFADKAPQGLRSLPPEQKVKIRLELMALTKEIPHTEIQNAYRHAFQHEFYEATRWMQSKKSVTHAVSLAHWQRRSEWLLMAAFYHQPWLIKEKLYLLELYHFNDTTLQEAYTLFHICLEKETNLSKEVVHASFIEVGLSHCVERFCDKDLLRHGIFLQEQKSKDLVLRSWESLWSYAAQLPQLQKDLKDAQRAMTVKVSPENWVRAKHLSTLVEQLKNETYTQ